jgi:hypothetical protein
MSIGEVRAATNNVLSDYGTIGSPQILMILNPITINGYLHSWQFVTSVRADTCISYASVWRLKTAHEFVKLQDSEIQLHPSDYDNKEYYFKNITDKIVRVKYGDVLSVYVDRDHYHEIGCNTLLFSSRERLFEDPIVARFHNYRDNTITRLSVNKFLGGPVDYIFRAVALQAFVQGWLSPP